MRPYRLCTSACIALVLLTGCAPYAANTLEIRNTLSAGDHASAFRAVTRAAHGPSKLLYFLEGGLIAHYDGDYDRSNALLDRAERVADALFTRSLSRELASFITSDETRDYRGEPYELVFIHYYRALNYWYLGLPEDALVECRKANLKLAVYTRDEEARLSYRNDAFIHYLTALIYEAEQEYNDAYVSLRDATVAYRAYEDAFGIPAPDALEADLARVEAELDYASVDDAIVLNRRQNAGEGELVVFAELGFIPRKTQEELNLPVYKSDLRRVRSDGVAAVSRHVHRRRHHRHASGVDYWLRVALPRFETTSTSPARVRILAAGHTVHPAPAQDLDGIARTTLEEKAGSILTRTTARALVKLAATKGAEKKSEWFGFLVNLFTASTEKADTRSWVTLPREVRIGRLKLPPGTHAIVFQSLDRRGRVTSETTRTVTIRAGKRTFINQRLYG